MNDEAKKIMEALRNCDIVIRPRGFVKISDILTLRHAADLIEQLFAELEQEQQANAGLEIMLTAAQSAAETFKRQRDAAIRDWKHNKNSCFGCKHFFENGNKCSLPIEQRKHSFLCWEWRGLQEAP